MIGRKGSWGVGAAAAVLLLATAQPAHAQHYRFDIGVFGGGSWFSASLDEDHLGIDNSARYKAGWVAGTQATFWTSPKLGIRADLAYTERPLVLADEEAFLQGQEDANLLREDINLWGISGDLLFRFRAPNERWMGSEFLPYLALGAGIQRTNPAENTTVGGAEDAEDGALWGTPQRAFLTADDNTLMGLVGLGGDWRVSPNFAVRLEVNDRFFDPSIFRLGYNAANNTFFLSEEEDEDVGKVTHWVSGQLGLHLLVGVQEPAQVVVAPPPPAAPVAPARPAPPRVDAVSICVIDPTAPGGIRMVSALYRQQQRDTVVVAMGDTVAFRSQLPTAVRLAPSATWYTQGEPLVMDFPTAPRRVEFLTVGTSRVIPGGDLAFLGYMGGMPVYAARGDVADVQDEWNDMRSEAAEGDLDDWLADRRELREAFDDIDVLYVPVQPYGCVFQAVQRQEEVRKGGK